jgi:hypothetical protein
MNVYNLTQDEVFNIDKGNSTKNIDFNLDSDNQFAIYDSNNYDNIRPIFKEFMEDYSIEPNRDDFNREIELQKKREQNEIMKNYGEISITSDPRITKYSDTYSVLPYSDFKVMNTTEADSDIVKSLDHCKGEWVNVDRCNPNKPCKRILQEYIIQNPNYTGDHCRVDRERVRDGDTRMVYCDQYNNCNGHGRCEGYDICTCDEGYSGNNCDNTCPNTNCNNGVAVPPDCNCSCNPGYSGNNCDVCNKDCGIHGQIENCNCICKDGYTGPNCNIPPNKCEHPVKINCNNGTCIEGTCNCEDGYTGNRCQKKQDCNDIISNYCGENGKVIGNIPDGCSCLCNFGYSGDRCENINKCDIPCINGKISGYAGNCECLCDPGYTGSSCDTYDCSLLNDELNKYNIHNRKIIDFPSIENSNEYIQFNLSSFDHSEQIKNLPQYIKQFNKLIENNLIEQILDCYKPTEIIINIDNSYYYDSIVKTLMEIFDRISNYNNGEYLKNISIFKTHIYINSFEGDYRKILSDISTKYYSEYKGKLRNIDSEDYEEFTKLPNIKISYDDFNPNTKPFKQNCPLTKKYKNFINDNLPIKTYFPLEYFADCIPVD